MYLCNDKEKTQLARPLAQAEKPCRVIFIKKEPRIALELKKKYENREVDDELSYFLLEL